MMLALAIALFVLTCVLPGRLALAACEGEAPALERVLLAPVLGFALVSWTTHTLAMVPLELAELAPPPALRVLVACLLIGLVLRRALPLARGGSRAPREAVAVALASMLVVGLALLHYDRDLFGFTCTYRAVAVATQVRVGSFWGEMGHHLPLMVDRENDMHGVVALLSVFPSVLGFFGDRVSMAVIHGLTVAGVYVVARRLPLGAGAAALAAAVVAVHPMMLRATVNDVNAVALFSTVAMWGAALTLGSSVVSARTVGLLSALAVGAWHPALLGLPAPLAVYLSRQDPARRRAVARTLLGWLVVGALPWIVRHSFAFGHPFTLETFRENAAATHEGLGGLRYHGLLNVPFVDHVVRTPMNGFPVFLELPLAVLRSTGSVLTALAGLGVVWGTAHRRALALGLLGWALALGLPMLVQENWLEPEKMQIPLVAFLPFVVAIACGVQALVDAPPAGRARRMVAWAVLALLLHAGAWAARRVDAPVDERFVERWPHLRAERPDELAFFRAEATRIRPWPDYRALASDGRGSSTRLAVVADAAARPTFDERQPSPREAVVWLAMPQAYELFLRQARPGPASALEVPVLEAASWLSLDLSAPLVPSHEPAAVAVPAPVDLEPAEGIAVHRDLHLPWRPEPADLAVFAAAAPPHDVYVVVVNPSPDMLAELREELPERHELFERSSPAPAMAGVAHRLEGRTLTVGIPRGARLLVLDVTSIEPSRIYAWETGPSSLASPAWRGPRRLLHF